METVTLQNLAAFARDVLGRLPKGGKSAVVIALEGDLGAGKTTFVQALARELGITETLQSPTYVLMKKYQTSNPKFQTLIHIDAYRLKSAAEFAALKPEMFLTDSHALVCIEWQKNVAGALPKADITVRFSSDDAKEEERYIEVV